VLRVPCKRPLAFGLTFGFGFARSLCGAACRVVHATLRIVTILEGTEGCPCGGTHVGDVREIGGVNVTGVRVKKGVTRVSYTVEGMKEHK